MAPTKVTSATADLGGGVHCSFTKFAYCNRHREHIEITNFRVDEEVLRVLACERVMN